MSEVTPDTKWVVSPSQSHQISFHQTLYCFYWLILLIIILLYYYLPTICYRPRLSDLTDAQRAELGAKLRDEEQSSQPLLGQQEPIDALEKEYEGGDQGFVNSIKWLKQEAGFIGELARQSSKVRSATSATSRVISHTTALASILIDLLSTSKE